MITLQQKMIDQFEAIAKKNGCELVQVSGGGSNVGRLMAQLRNPAYGGQFQTVAYLDYRFNSGQNTIEFNGNRPSHGSDMSELFASTEDAKINQVMRKWQQLIVAGKRNKGPVDEPERPVMS